MQSFSCVNAFFPNRSIYIGLGSFLSQLAEQGVGASQALQVQKLFLVSLKSLLYQTHTLIETASTVLTAYAVVSSQYRQSF